MTNPVNPLGQRPSTPYQGSTPAGQAPASGNTPQPQLTASGRAELERVFAEIPAELRNEVRQLLDSGKVPSEYTSKRLIPFSLKRDLLQLAADVANIAGMKSLSIVTSIPAASLISMHDNCPSLQALTVLASAPGQPNGVAEFLRAGHGFTSLDLHGSNSSILDIVKALGSSQGVKNVAIGECQSGGPLVDALSQFLRANRAIESLELRPFLGLRQDALESLSDAIAKSHALDSLTLNLHHEVVDTGRLDKALEGRSMKQLTLEGAPVALLRVVEAIWEGRLRAEKLKVDQSHQLMGVPAFPSGFICKVCDLIRSSTNVGALFVRSSEFGLLISCAQPLPSQDSTRWISNPPWSAHCQRNRSMP